MFLVCMCGCGPMTLPEGEGNFCQPSTMSGIFTCLFSISFDPWDNLSWQFEFSSVEQKSSAVFL